MISRHKAVKWHLVLSVFGSLLLFVLGSCNTIAKDQQNIAFDADRSMRDLETQVEMGPRIPGTDGHQRFQEWIIDQVESYGWESTLQTNLHNAPQFVNIIADKHTQSVYWILLGTHYDTRQYADQSPLKDDQTQPVPGANDGASGVAVLTELARILPDNLNCQVSLVFFDAEDQGNIGNRQWSEGSGYFADSLVRLPDEVVIIDMVGDASLNIYLEGNSSAELSDVIWKQAKELGYQRQFIPEIKYHMIDDHLPFIRLGIPTTLIIDFDYPAWHTTDDNLSQVSADSLQVVGDTLLTWLLNHPQCQEEQ